jgi:putative transposase
MGVHARLGTKGGEKRMTSTHAKLLYHVVFSTKYRVPSIGPEVRDKLYPYIEGIIRHRKGSLIEIGGMPDHVHALFQLAPHVSVSTLLQHIKGSSSRWIQEERILRDHFAWQLGYGVFSVSESNVPRVRQYIQRQEEHHTKESFACELVRLLHKHHIPFEGDPTA